MARYEQRDFFFEAPDGWHDRTVVAIVAPAKLGKTIPSTFVVTHEVLRQGEQLNTFAMRQLGQLAKTLDDFELMETRDVNVGGVPAVQSLFSSLANNGPLVQRVTFVAVNSSSVLAFTATMSPGDVAEMTPVFDRLLSTVGFPGVPPGGRP